MSEQTPVIPQDIADGLTGTKEQRAAALAKLRDMDKAAGERQRQQVRDVESAKASATLAKADGIANAAMALAKRIEERKWRAAVGSLEGFEDEWGRTIRARVVGELQTRKEAAAGLANRKPLSL